MKPIITSLLVAAFLALPFQAQSQSAPPPEEEKAARVVAACITVIVVFTVGIIVINGLKKMCKKIPPVGGSTNAPPDDLTMLHPTIQNPTSTNGNSIIVQRSQTMAHWENALEVRFDDAMNATALVNGQVVSTNVQSYVVNGKDGETVVYYDLRGIIQDQKPLEFLRMMTQ